MKQAVCFLSFISVSWDASYGCIHLGVPAAVLAVELPLVTIVAFLGWKKKKKNQVFPHIQIAYTGLTTSFW